MSERAGLWMRVDGPEREKPLAFDNMEDRPIRGTTDWSRYSIVLEVPTGATNIALGVLLAGDGHVWMDDVLVVDLRDRAHRTARVKAARSRLVLGEWISCSFLVRFTVAQAPSSVTRTRTAER